LERKLLGLSWSAIWRSTSKVKYALHVKPGLELKCLVGEDRYSFLFDILHPPYPYFFAQDFYLFCWGIFGTGVKRIIL